MGGSSPTFKLYTPRLKYLHGSRNRAELPNAPLPSSRALVLRLGCAVGGCPFPRRRAAALAAVAPLRVGRGGLAVGLLPRLCVGRETPPVAAEDDERDDAHLDEREAAARPRDR